MRTLVSLCLLFISCSTGAPTANPDDGTSTDTSQTDSDSDLQTQVKPPDQLLIEPSDLMTSVRDAPLEISVGYVLNLPSDEAMASLDKGNVSLRTISGVHVPILLKEIPFDTQQPGPKVRRIEVVPLETLASEWHEIWVDFDGLELDPHPRLAPVQGRTYRSRFHPDSQPVLRSVELCLSADESVDRAVRLDFSEPLTFLPDEIGVTASPFRVLVDGNECTMLATFERGGPAIEAFASSYQFGCTPSKSADVIAIEMRRELLGASGQPVSLVRGGAGPSLTLAYAQGYTLGCRYWHLP